MHHDGYKPKPGWCLTCARRLQRVLRLLFRDPLHGQRHYLLAVSPRRRRTPIRISFRESDRDVFHDLSASARSHLYPQLRARGRIQDGPPWNVMRLMGQRTLLRRSIGLLLRESNRPCMASNAQLHRQHIDKSRRRLLRRQRRHLRKPEHASRGLSCRVGHRMHQLLQHTPLLALGHNLGPLRALPRPGHRLCNTQHLVRRPNLQRYRHGERIHHARDGHPGLPRERG